MQAFTEVLDRLRIYLTSYQLDAFNLYANLIVEATPRVALTSITDRQAIYGRHFLESLTLLRMLDERGLVASPVVDIGSGAGIPGLAIKIARPDLRITLVEATGKKAEFLRTAIEALRLDGVTVLHARAEEAAHDPAHRGGYALALARAVAPLPVLLELTLPFLRVGGVLAAPKGSATRREIAESAHALHVLGGELEAAEQMLPPYDGATRQTLALVRKVGPTPDAYPRRPGIPKKRPL